MLQSGISNSAEKILQVRFPIQICIFIFLFSIAFLVSSGEIDSYDGTISFLVIESLVQEQNLAITDPIYHLNEPYSRYGLGFSLLAIPLYYLGLIFFKFNLPQYNPLFFSLLINQLVFALLGLVLYRLGRYLDLSNRASIVLTICGTLAALTFPYAKTFFSELATSLLLIFSVLAIKKSPTSLLWLMVAGFSLGFAILVKETLIILLPWFYLYYLILTKDKNLSWQNHITKLFSLTLPVLLFILAVLAYNQLRYQAWFNKGYLGETFSEPFYEGLAGLLISPGKGLLFFSPLTFLGLLSLPWFWKRHKAEAVLAFGITFTLLAFYCSWYCWEGGICWGPRFLVAAVPFLTLPLTVIIKGFAQKPIFIKWIFISLLIISFIIQIIAVLVPYKDHWENVVQKAEKTFQNQKTYFWKQQPEKPDHLVKNQWVFYRFSLIPHLSHIKNIFHKTWDLQLFYIDFPTILFRASNLGLIFLIIMLFCGFLMTLFLNQNSFTETFSKSRFLLSILSIILIFALISVLKPILSEKNHGLNAFYYDNIFGEGKAPMFIDPEIFFSAHPVNSFRAEALSKPKFSILWSGQIFIQTSGFYLFQLVSKDGSLLFIDQTLLVNNGGRHEKESKTEYINLTEGWHDLEVKYFNQGNQPEISLWWKEPGKKRFHLLPTKILKYKQNSNLKTTSS